ncbi:hypothetical protein AAG570_001925 [Ranatra chinensis]|uniref:Enhancer of mRNA-decapping protein 4 C-terminal domain-containing protein n=1 Tax=Ranatra chinensis TaxID=642074 RepID=A0ABD0Y9X5_9HEMI
MYVCERVAPHQVFTQSGPLLQQHVLLSLIQQLSADMNHHTEIRHRYLEEAVMNLDPKNSATREHMPAVLSALHKQLQLYISLHPNAPIAKRVRMLQMATQSLLA